VCFWVAGEGGWPERVAKTLFPTVLVLALSIQLVSPAPQELAPIALATGVSPSPALKLEICVHSTVEIVVPALMCVAQ